jgi:hypothetical protein
MGIAPAYFEIGHDFVRRQGALAGHEQGMDLRHGAINAPGAAHRAPLGDELIARGREGIMGFGFLAHIFSKY